MKATWTVTVGMVLAACGGGGHSGTDGSVVVDAPRSIDAPADVMADAMADAMVDAPIVLIDAPMIDAPSGPCNPLAQTGCGVGEKCNWIYDQLMPTVVGHVGCEPEGAVALGGACGPSAIGPDSCVKGAECVASECKQICDIQGGAPMCDANHACTRYQNVFVDGGVNIAGVCDPACDPLTQELAFGANRTACGSADPTQPVRGCYGYDAYTCSGVAPTVALSVALTLTDRVAPAGNYVNACAPGFMPLLVADTGSMTAVCTGFCAALETDNTPAHVNNAKGDPTALGKLPTDAAPAAGNATCQIGKKGSEASSVCKFLWPYLVDGSGNLTVTPTTDTLGICMATAHYKYDSNGNGMLDAADNAMSQLPCNTLPPRSGLTTGPFDDAADFQCQKLANSQLVAPNPSGPGSFAIWNGGPVPLARHDFR